MQGVFFRATCAREATRLDVRGWVRNTADGRVEAVFEGPEAAVASDGGLVSPRSTRRGRRSASRSAEEPPEGLDGFRIIG